MVLSTAFPEAPLSAFSEVNYFCTADITNSMRGLTESRFFYCTFTTVSVRTLLVSPPAIVESVLFVLSD